METYRQTYTHACERRAEDRDKAVVVVTPEPEPAAKPTAPPQVYTRPYAPRSYPRGYNPARGYGYGYGAGAGVAVGYGHGSYYAEPRPRRAVADHVFEIGVRGSAGGTDTAAELAGLGFFVRSRRGPLGIEASIDSLAAAAPNGAVVGRIPVLGAVMLYLNPQSPARVYGLLGGGISLEQDGSAASGTITTEAGLGLDIDVSPRLSLSADVRALADIEDPTQTRANPSVFGLGTVGLSLKF
jgi:hypothetical protein